MDDNELYKKVRARVKNKIRNASDKDIIIDQEKEIMYYRKTIEQLKEKTKIFEEDNELPKQYENVDEIRIKNEDYIIKYNRDIDIVLLSVHFIKLVNDKEIIRIAKMNEFDITNITRQRIYEQEHNIDVM
nr:MAG TPA: hypothetical protein [Caudoviricetes sp.]